MFVAFLAVYVYSTSVWLVISTNVSVVLTNYIGQKKVNNQFKLVISTNQFIYKNLNIFIRRNRIATGKLIKFFFYLLMI